MKRVILLIIILSLASCSRTPSLDFVEQSLYKESLFCREPCYKIINIKKTNGIRDGIKYTLYFKGTLEFTKDSYASSLYASENEPIGRFRGIMSERMFRKDRCIRVGEQYIFTGIMYFVKTEKGWLPSERGIENESVRRLRNN